MKKKKNMLGFLALQKKRKIWIIAVLVMALILAVIIDVRQRESISFNIVDKCGRFVNLFSHTINDEDECGMRCRAKCDAEDLEFSGVEFNLGNIENLCNSCECICYK